ncbi:MAG: cyclic nucleotide-binding domain-containing protein [Candidatus Riflebacteria bacterium]|nr:cyclic nucleotide-binding domain-containing protein [Candidatus Riflebacteria bacterium]
MSTPPGEREVLRELPLFKGLADDELDLMVAIMDEVALPKGLVLFREGTLANSLYIVCSGAIEIFHQNADGTRAVVATLEQGSCLGEMGLVRSSTRALSASATVNASLWVLKRDKLETLSLKEPRLWGKVLLNIASILADRVEALDRQVARLSSREDGPAEGKRGFLWRLLGG